MKEMDKEITNNQKELKMGKRKKDNRLTLIGGHVFDGNCKL